MANVVIMVWKQHMNSGFGDLLRGTIYLYKLSQHMNFELIVDTQLHPVSKLLVSRPHRYSNYVVEHQSEINDAITQTGEYVQQLIRMNQAKSNGKPLLITTNFIDSYVDAPSNDCKHFMRAHLIPTHEFKRYFNERCIAYHISKNYSIAHFRLGDEELNGNESNVEHYRQLCAEIDVHLATIPNLYIMSDSFQFKTYLCKKIRPELVHRIIPTKPIHLANPDVDIDKMRETMFDLMLLTNARIIKTHSRYHWVSGFVNWISHIFNVPVVDMKPKMRMKLNMGAVSVTTPPTARTSLNKPHVTIQPLQRLLMPLFKTNNHLRIM